VRNVTKTAMGEGGDEDSNRRREKVRSRKRIASDGRKQE
jgi:hypothetical protein